MALNYNKRLENLKSRRYDEDLHKSILSESFGKRYLPQNLEYLVECMKPIDATYNSKTLLAAERIQTHLENGLQLTFTRNYRRQGSVMTKTNIRIHSDIDLLAIIGDYHYLEPILQPSSNPYQGNPDQDILEFRSSSTSILTDIYDQVDTTGSRCISVLNKNLKRKVDVVFSYWYNTKNYEDNKAHGEYYRGIYLYDFNKKERELDYPFANIINVNHRGDSTNDGLRRGIRLLKTLRADSENKIELSSFQLTTIVYSLDNSELIYTKGNELTIAKNISDHLNLLLLLPDFRRDIQCPNGTEKPLADDSTVADIKLLKADLDDLISDCEAEMKSALTRINLVTY